MDVAIRDAMVPGGPTAFFDSARAVGATAIEIEVNAEMRTPHIARPGGAAYGVGGRTWAAELAQRLRDEGLRASALLIANDFAEAEAFHAWAVRAVRAATALDVPVVLIDPLVRDSSMTPDVARQRFVSSVHDILWATDDAGVDLAIENHGPVANDPAWLDAVLAELDDPRVGLTLDTGNFYWFGFPREEVYGLVEKYAARAKHTHVKNINFPADVADRRREVGHGYKEYCCGVDEGNLDLRRVVKILRDAGYDRDLCVEDESLFKHPAEERVGVLRREVEALRAALGAER